MLGKISFTPGNRPEALCLRKLFVGVSNVVVRYGNGFDLWR